FGEDGVANADIFDAFLRYAEILVDAPGDRAMVDEDVLDRRPVLQRLDRDAVATAWAGASELTDADADMPEDDVAGADLKHAADERDAGRGRRLAGDGRERLANDEAAVDFDLASDVEDDLARPLRGKRGAEAPRTFVVQRRDVDRAALVAALGRPVGAGRR